MKTDLDPNDTYVGLEFFTGKGCYVIGAGGVLIDYQVWLVLLDIALHALTSQVNEIFLFFSLRVPAAKAG